MPKDKNVEQQRAELKKLPNKILGSGERQRLIDKLDWFRSKGRALETILEAENGKIKSNLRKNLEFVQKLDKLRTENIDLLALVKKQEARNEEIKKDLELLRSLDQLQREHLALLNEFGKITSVSGLMKVLAQKIINARKNGNEIITIVDLMKALGQTQQPIPQVNKSEIHEIKGDDEVENALIRIIASGGSEPSHVDDITLKSGFSTAVVSGALVMLELNGKIRNMGGMRYSLAPHSKS